MADLHARTLLAALKRRARPLDPPDESGAIPDAGAYTYPAEDWRAKSPNTRAPESLEDYRDRHYRARMERELARRAAARALIFLNGHGTR